MKYRLDPSFHKDSGSFVGWLKCLILKIPHFLVVEGERMTSYRERQISLCLVSFGGQICRVDGCAGWGTLHFPLCQGCKHAFLRTERNHVEAVQPGRL